MNPTGFFVVPIFRPMSSAALPRPSAARELLDLLASMRFAITLLTVICIASVIGTVVNQGEAMGGYIDKFGDRKSVV